MSFNVRIEPSGHQPTVQAEETVLSAALRSGVVLPYSCRNGSCGSCKGRVLSGEIDYGHYDAAALTDEEKRAGSALFCQAIPCSNLVIQAEEVSAASGMAIKTLPCRVVSMYQAAHDVMILSLILPRNEQLKYLAGQYVDILLRDGQRRSFSIATAPRSESLQLHVRRVPGGKFTEHVFSKMKERDLLRFHGPLGVFFLRSDSDRPVIFMAGGTGLAPIKAILEQAFAQELRRPMHVFWGVRARRDLYLSDLVESWRDTYEHLHFTPVLSDPQSMDRWTGRTGWVHAAVLQDYRNLSCYEVYASGPPPMIIAARGSFFERGLCAEHFYFDSFEFSKCR